MKKILFDLLLSQPTGTSKFHGGGEYMKRIFRELVLTKPDDVELVAYFNHKAFLDDWLLDLMKTHGIRSYDIQSAAEVSDIFGKEHFDIFYSGLPYDYRKEWFPNDVYKIGTFHGMRSAECPHDIVEYKYATSFYGWLKARIWTLLKDTPFGYERSCRRAIHNYESCIKCFDKLICDSQHTAYSLKVYYPWLPADAVEVCYCPLKYSEQADAKPHTEKFILLLGGDRWIKNAYRGVKAIDALYEKGYLRDIKTVIVGGLTKRILGELKNKEQFVLKGYIESKELESLYRECAVFLYPTLNEGFGAPPLEAMRYGRTCVVSAVCSLPEICGEAVYYVNPYDIGEIQNRILWALNEPLTEKRVKAQFEMVSKRQSVDLQNLCKSIFVD